MGTGVNHKTEKWSRRAKKKKRRRRRKKCRHGSKFRFHGVADMRPALCVVINGKKDRPMRLAVDCQLQGMMSGG